MSKSSETKNSKPVLDAVMNASVNFALLLLGISILCFVFGKTGWGFAVLAVSMFIGLILLGIMILLAILASRIVRRIPHK